MGEALWDENWSGLFLFPLFYLSCHYVSSAVFNDGSSLQAVSGCTAVGGRGTVEAGGTVFLFSLFFDVIVFKRHETSLADATNTNLCNSEGSIFIILYKQWQRGDGMTDLGKTNVQRTSIVYISFSQSYLVEALTQSNL